MRSGKMRGAKVDYEKTLNSNFVTRSATNPSKRLIEEQEDAEAIRQSLASSAGTATFWSRADPSGASSSSAAPAPAPTPKPRKARKHMNDLSPGLPPCGGSGSKPSHAVVLERA